MSGKKTSINPVAGLRVKTLIEEQNLTQKDLAEKMNYSQKTISGIVRGHQSCSREFAEALHSLYPEYRTGWILGIEEYKNTAEQTNALVETLDTEADLLDTGFFAFARLNGYTITPATPSIDENVLPAVATLRAIHAGIYLEKDGRRIHLSLADLRDIENQISDIIAVLLNYKT